MNVEWKKTLAERCCEKAMDKIDNILKEVEGHLTDDELDQLRDCWEIIHIAMPQMKA